ncbi:MAG TPA: STAS domain-containing protein [Baekduia sp.]
MLPPDFSVTVGRDGDAVRLAVAGELDLATAPLVAEHLDGVGRALVLDLAGVTFMDSSGVALLIEATRRAAGEGWSLSIARTPPDALAVLELCGLLDVLPLES